MRLSPYLGLAFGVACTAGAAILIRLTDAPSLVIAAYRLTMASVLLLPVALLRSGEERRRLTGRDWRWMAASGGLLAVHFASWISSLAYTSVASSVVLVTTYPLFVGLGAHWLMRERLSSGMLGGILVAVIGGGIIGYGDFSSGRDALFGDALAVVGAFSGGGYFMIGRHLRSRLSLMTYIAVVYSTAAVILAVIALGAGYPVTGYSRMTYMLLLALAVGPQLLGHSSLNWALKYLSAAFVSVSALGEPVGATVLAAVVLGEPVSPLKLAGGVFILTGIYLTLREETKNQR